MFYCFKLIIGNYTEALGPAQEVGNIDPCLGRHLIFLYYR